MLTADKANALTTGDKIIAGSLNVDANLNISGSTTLNNNTTCMGTLNVHGNIIGSGTAISNLNYTAITNKPDLSVYATNTNLTSISTFSKLNIDNLNATSTTIFNKTNFTNLLVSGASTCSSSLNVVGNIIGNGNVGISNISPNLTLDVGSTDANHNIGRAILTVGNIHTADKLDF